MADEETTLAAQTEETNLAMADEASLGSRTVPSTGWHNIDPSSYGELGAQYKKLSRDPITKRMQQQKGMLVDMDSGIAYEIDITKDSVERHAPHIYRCTTHHCGNTGQSQWRPSSVVAGATPGFVVPALGDLAERYLVFARGSNKDANNGLFMVANGSTGIKIRVPGVEAEAAPPSNFVVDLAGYRGAEDDLFFDADGNLNSNGAIDFTTWEIPDGMWLYIGGALTANRFDTPEFFGAALVDVNGVAPTKITFAARSWDVAARASLDLTDVALNLDTVVEAITAGAGGNAITVAAVADGDPAVKAELDMDAAGNSAHIDTIVRAKLGGVAGNLITVEVTTGALIAAGVLTEIGTHVKLAIKTAAPATTVADLEALIATSTLIEVKTAGTGATVLDATDAFDSVPLAGGVDADAPTVSEVGDAVTLHFTPGETTVAEIEAVIDATSTKIRVKREGTPGDVLAAVDDEFAAENLAGGNSGADTGAGKQIDVYFTRWWHNTARDAPDFAKPSAVFEMTYPELDDGDPMYEYMLGNMIDQCVVNLPTTGKATMQVSWKGTKTLQLTATRKAGPADAIDPVSKLGVSTSTDLERLRVEGIDDLGITSDIITAKITFSNNIKPQKQLATLGAKRMNKGDHRQQWEADVIFVTSDIADAVRDNRTAHATALTRNRDFGCMWHIQAMTLDQAGKKFPRNELVQISSMGSGHEHDKFGSTGSLSFFAYLPPLPEEGDEA